LRAPVRFCHENEKFPSDSSDPIVDRYYERVRGASFPLSGQTLLARSCHPNRGGTERLDSHNADTKSYLKMNFAISSQALAFIAKIVEAGVPALRVAFTLAVIVFLYGGVVIFRRRHQFFDSDPNVEDDVPVVRHNREEGILFVWAGLTTVLIFILIQVWRA
jgi:hypothetical protein